MEIIQYKNETIHKLLIGRFQIENYAITDVT